MDERLEALLWEELEGKLSTEDRRLLEDRLAGDGEARAARERLSRLNEELSGLEAVSPPPELRPRIRQAVAGRVVEGSARRSPSSFLDAVRQTLQTLPARARFAYLAAGILVGVVVSLLLGGGFESTTPLDRGALYGAANLGGVEWLEIELPDGAGVLRLRRDGAKLTTALTSSDPLELEVERSEDRSVAVEVSAEGSPILEQRIAWNEIPGS